MALVHNGVPGASYTGWTRSTWVDLNDRLVRGVWAHTGADHAAPRLPGPPGGYGPRIDALEAFARSMQLATFRLAGSDSDELGAAQWYTDGLRTGTDPSSPTRWPSPGESGQAKVEAASIALSLLLEPQRLWDPLPTQVKAQVIAWFEAFVGSTDFPPTNWVWFQVLVEAFLRRVGGRWSADDVARCLAIHESLAVDDGWYRDGPGRSYDHYVGWSLQTYPILLAHVAPDLPGVAGLHDRWRERLHSWLSDAVHLVGGHGGPLIQGRSLTYRFAVAAPFWAGVLADATPLSPGLTRRTVSGLAAHFVDRGVPDETDVLSTGWFGQFPPMIQSYTGPGSPYWAGIGMLGLLLRGDHPVWTADEQPLPVETADFERVVRAPGWLVSGTVADGVVRVVNHGTDHAAVGAQVADTPWYPRMAYSTHTAPDVIDAADDGAVGDQVALLDQRGRSSDRTGFATLNLQPNIAVSQWRTHWITPDPTAFDFGHGIPGRTRYGPWLTVGSVLRGAVEVRLVMVDRARDRRRDYLERRLRDGYVSPTALRVAGAAVPTVEADTDQTTDRSMLRSYAINLIGLGRTGAHPRHGANMLTDDSLTPWVATSGPPVSEQVYAAAAVLGSSVGPPDPARLPSVRVDGRAAHVTWPDGIVDVVHLPPPPARRRDGDYGPSLGRRVIGRTRLAVSRSRRRPWPRRSGDQVRVGGELSRRPRGRPDRSHVRAGDR